MPQATPPRWTTEQFDADIARAIDLFREERLQEPLEQYLGTFDSYQSTVENLIEGSVDLTKLQAEAVQFVIENDLLMAVRYLASPAISEDDLKVLADVASLTPSQLKKRPEDARRVVDTALMALDRNRFPWVTENREPNEAERYAAIIATTALMATQRVQTDRRRSAKNVQEEAVAAYLEGIGMTRAEPKKVTTVSDLLPRGYFCREAEFGTRKADLIVSLWDGRGMPIECKVSNSSTNSVKRINNDAAVKARTWITEFGRLGTIPVAVISGVFKAHNLIAAQDDGLTIVWAHNLDALGDFIEGTRT
ncbi:MAG: XamI family restriction endonuclease [Propionibacteriaceae bacterium]|nr:XamI family restriction endonuclease [Propionibacteriaceae bacterium]